MKIYLSSAENSKNTITLLNTTDVKNVLVSYYYLRNKAKSRVLKTLIPFKKMGCSIMLDSGAHSFLNEAGLKSTAQKKTKKGNTPPDEYFEEYIKWLQEYKDFFDIIVELDIDGIVGYEKVKYWQNRLYDVVGKKLLCVFHDTIPNCYEEWDKYCERFGFVGIGGKPKFEIVDRLFKNFKEKPFKCHGFALTDKKYCMNYPFYSVDSSSWNIGARFGTLMRCNNFDLVSINRKDNNKAKKLKYGAFSDLYKSASKIDVQNASAFVKWENNITKLWDKKGVLWEE